METAYPPAVDVDASERGRLMGLGRPPALVLAALFILLLASPSRAQAVYTDSEILGEQPMFRVEAVRTALTAYRQQGHGYQSKAGPVLGPGLETLTVFQPQVEMLVRQGDRIRHHIWAPVDIITSASASAIDRRPAPPDVISSASQVNKSFALQWTASYQASPAVEWFTRAGVHVEEPFRSWNVGLGAKVSLADDNTVVAIDANQAFDWFDRFFLQGGRNGRTARTTSNGNVGLTQLLSPTTIASVSYGFTLQEGELGNTWNIVPLTSGTVGLEVLPAHRIRHALVGRLAQWLPWNGALKTYYRFYADDWGIVAHTVEVQVHQRFASWLYVAGTYRVHRQERADFFSTLAPRESALFRTADSDLDGLVAKSFGLSAHWNEPLGSLRDTEFSVGYERYVRSNDLDVNVYTCTSGFRF